MSIAEYPPVPEIDGLRETLDDLGASIASSLARLNVGQPPIDLIERDIVEDRRRVDETKKLAQRLDEVDAEAGADVAQMSGYYHGIEEVGQFAKDQLLLPADEREPSAGGAAEVARVCIGAAQDVIGFNLANALRRYQAYRRHKYDTLSEPTQLRYVDGIGDAITEIVEAARVSLESRTLVAMRAQEDIESNRVLALLLFVASTGCAAARLDTSFGDVYGPGLAQDLISEGLVREVSVPSSRDQVLTVTDDGVERLRELISPR